MSLLDQALADLDAATDSAAGAVAAAVAAAEDAAAGRIQQRVSALQVTLAGAATISDPAPPSVPDPSQAAPVPQM